MDKPLYLFVGPSGSGKTTIANMLESEYNLNQVQSYTTRSPRYENETGHTFISDEEFDKLENIAAYTEYNGYRYCTTSDQLDDCNIYVIDIPGVKTLLKNYTNKKRPIRIIYFESTVTTRIDRMIDRGESDMRIISRLRTDEEYDWHEALLKLEYYYNIILNRDVLLYVADANKNKKEVLQQITSVIDKE